MGPSFAEIVPAREPDAAREREIRRYDAALQRGWVIRYDIERFEYFAARELHAAKGLGNLLDEIDAADGIEAPHAIEAAP